MNDNHYIRHIQNMHIDRNHGFCVSKSGRLFFLRSDLLRVYITGMRFCSAHSIITIGAMPQQVEFN